MKNEETSEDAKSVVLLRCNDAGLKFFVNVKEQQHRNKSLTAKLLHQGYRYHKLRKAFFLKCFSRVCYILFHGLIFCTRYGVRFESIKVC